MLFQGSTSISSADLFGDSEDSSIDLAASDLLNRLSFQVFLTLFRNFIVNVCHLNNEMIIMEFLCISSCIDVGWGAVPPELHPLLVFAGTTGYLFP